MSTTGHKSGYPQPKHPSTQSPSLGTRRPLPPRTSTGTAHSSSIRGASVWSESTKEALGVYAVRFITSMPENMGRAVTSQQIRAILDRNPNYEELCETIAGMGFKLDRVRFAKALLAAIPDQQSPEPARTEETPTTNNLVQRTTEAPLSAANTQIDAPRASRPVDLTQSLHPSLNQHPHPSPHQPSHSPLGQIPHYPHYQHPHLPPNQVPHHSSYQQSPLPPHPPFHPPSNQILHPLSNTPTAKSTVTPSPMGGATTSPDKAAKRARGRPKKDKSQQCSASEQQMSNEASNPSNTTRVGAGKPVEIRNLANFAGEGSVSTNHLETFNAPGSRLVLSAEPPPQHHEQEKLPAETIEAQTNRDLIDKETRDARAPAGGSLKVHGRENRELSASDASPKRTSAASNYLPSTSLTKPSTSSPKKHGFSLADIELLSRDPYDLEPELPDHLSYLQRLRGADEGNGAITSQQPKPTGMGLPLRPDSAAATSPPITRASRLRAAFSAKARPVEDRIERQTTFNPKTIARDILIAVGKHPEMRPLNSHLELIKQKASSVNRRLNLSAINWSAVDPGLPASRLKAVKAINAEAQANITHKASTPSSMRRTRQRLKEAENNANHTSATNTKDVSPSQHDTISLKRKNYDGKSSSASIVQEDTRQANSSGSTPLLPSNDAEFGTASIPPDNPNTSKRKRLSVTPSPSPSSNINVPSGGNGLTFGGWESQQRKAQSNGSPRTKLHITSTPARPSGLRNQILVDNSDEKRSPSTPSVVIEPRSPSSQVQYSNPWIADMAARYVKKVPPYDPGPSGHMVFKCEWDGCNASLHNFAALRKHMTMVHRGKGSGDLYHCLWTGCGRLVKSVDGNSDETLTKTPHNFQSVGSWVLHVEQEHLAPIRFTLGLGPRTGPEGYPILPIT